MLQSALFTKTLRDIPKDEVSKNAELLLRGGFIDKLMAGVYTFLPLGLRVINRIEKIVREEMNAIGGQELLMPALHPLENYERTKRHNIDVLFHTQLPGGQKIVLGQSHEEVVVPLAKKFLDSYRDLPFAVYQIQTKFRSELRPKSGIFRGREFIMKDLYSFHTSEDDFQKYYETVKKAYGKVFERLGLGPTTYYTHASGGTFSKHSHEFQTLTEAGEDTIYICHTCHMAVNEEVIRDLGGACPQCKGMLPKKGEKSIEIANIFPLGVRFSDAFKLTYKDAEGKEHLPVMGCYGIGITRLMGVIAEIHNDARGILWPDAVAPFAVHVIALSGGARSFAHQVYTKLTNAGVHVLFDDREQITPGEKFADADLIGIPWRVVVSDKTIEQHKIEVKQRGSSAAELMTEEVFFKKVC